MIANRSDAENLNVYQQILWLIESMADPRAHAA